ncbi:MAG: hypothetical protein J5990_12465 [Bacteroidales bacterium]|nr:hypothetical protein [Bacteroidales bacterium]
MKKIFILAISLCLITVPSALAFEKGYEKRVEAYAFAGLTDYNKSLFGVSMINGWRITPSIFLGAGIGFEYSNALYRTGLRDDMYCPQYMLPLYAEFKYNFHSSRNPSPYLLLDAGWVFNFGGEDDQGISKRAIYGLMSSIRFGIDLKVHDDIRLFASVGPRFQHARHTNRYPGTGEWEHEFIDEILSTICLHIGIIF